MQAQQRRGQVGRTYNFLLLLEQSDLLIQLLQPVLELILVPQDHHFIVLLHGQFHFPDFEQALELVALLLQIVPALLLLPPRLVTLVKISPQVLNLSVLLVVDGAELLGGHFHVLEHLDELVH